MSRDQNPARWWFLACPGICACFAIIGVVLDNEAVALGGGITAGLWLLFAVFLIKIW